MIETPLTRDQFAPSAFSCFFDISDGMNERYFKVRRNYCPKSPKVKEKMVGLNMAFSLLLLVSP